MPMVIDGIIRLTKVVQFDEMFTVQDSSVSYYNLDLSVRPSVTYLLRRFRTDCDRTRQEGWGRDPAGAKSIGFHGNPTVVMVFKKKTVL